jgi:hypothetical protein
VPGATTASDEYGSCRGTEAQRRGEAGRVKPRMDTNARRLRTASIRPIRDHSWFSFFRSPRLCSLRLR